MRGIKIFTTESYGGQTIAVMERVIQEKIDKWISENPSFFILNSSISLSKNELVISVVYDTYPPIVRIK